MSKPLEGKVVEIIDEYKIVLNLGESHGVKPGTKFQIVAPPLEIKDGDSLLGNLQFIKATVQITQVFDKFSVAENVEVYTEHLFQVPVIFKTSTKKLPVRVTETKIETEIKIGDKAIQVLPVMEKK